MKTALEQLSLPQAQPLLKVISASRRTDLCAVYPARFVELLEKHPPRRVHTLVVWTKNPANMLRPGPLRDALSAYRQVFVHFTVTGLGGSVIEPGVPPPDEALEMLRQVIAFTGDPRRVRLRFDPIVNIRHRGKVICNIDRFESLAAPAADMGITHVTTSWMELYPKVRRRLAANRMEPAEYDRESQRVHLERMAARLGLSLLFCCQPGLTQSSCIDGALFNTLHPDGALCDTRRAADQRSLCLCTRSLDIGWYSHTCSGGCAYCYATP